MRCPHCGNTDPKYFTASKQDYMSAFALDSEVVKCRYCNKEFEMQPVKELVDISVTREIVQPRRRVKGSPITVPQFPSYPLPPLDPSKASDLMLKSPLDELEKEKSRDMQLDKINTNKQAELDAWLKKKRAENLK